MIGMAKNIDNHKEEQKRIENVDVVRKNRDDKIRQMERGRLYRRGLPVLFMFTITAGVYGYSLGRKSGYLDGVHAGYVKGGQELMATWREYSEELRLSRNSDF